MSLEICLKDSWLAYITSIFWEAYRQGRSLDFLLEQILFVQEKNYGRFHKPFRIANWVE